MLRTLLISTVSAVVISACGANLSNVDQDGNPVSLKEETTNKVDTSQEPDVSVDVNIVEKSAGLALASVNASAYKLTLAGCASGYNNGGAQYTEAVANINLYQNDQGCLLKLDQFTVNGITYVPKAGSTFTTFLPPEVAVYENTLDAADIINVSVVTQLNSPITAGPETVSYAFTKVQAGNDTNGSVVDVSDAHNVSISGVPAPNFKIKSAALQATNAITASGAGLFDIQVECNVAIAASSCSGQDMFSAGAYKMSYVLVDTDSIATFDAAGLEAKFGGADESTIVIGNVRAEDPGVDNGGFNISGKQGPDQIHLNPGMTLIIRVDDNGAKSYTHFDINVTTISAQ